MDVIEAPDNATRASMYLIRMRSFSIKNLRHIVKIFAMGNIKAVEMFDKVF